MVLWGTYFWVVNAYVVLILICALFIMLLSKRVKTLNAQIDILNQEKGKIQIDFSKTKKNPLGTLISPDTKSMTLCLKKDGKITEISESLLKKLGYRKKQLLGKNIYGTLMVSPSKREVLEMNLVNRIFQNPKLYTEHETELITKSGEKIWISWTNRILTDKSGKPVEIRSVGFDITPRKKIEEELQFMASKDPQTGVLNRLSLLEIGTRELKRSIRYKHDFSVLALRLLAGDKKLTSLQVESLLKQVVGVCRHTIRDTDYLGRIGEAEFILLLPETEGKNISFLEGRLQEKIKEYNQKNSRLPIQVSFGSSFYTTKIKSIDELISVALSNIKKRKTR